MLAEGAGGGCLDIFFSHLSFLSSFSLSLGDGPIFQSISGHLPERGRKKIEMIDER